MGAVQNEMPVEFNDKYIVSENETLNMKLKPVSTLGCLGMPIAGAVCWLEEDKQILVS